MRVHAGRGDLVFAYEPDLRSDMLTKIMERDDFDAPMLEDPEQQLHEVVEVNEALATRCGLTPGPAWRLVDAGLWIGEDWDFDDFDRRMSNLCARCHD